MKKCPLLKATETAIFKGKTILVEEFQKCIGEDCMAWNEKYNDCDHFTTYRDVRNSY